jgi:hypothetical protein
MSRTENILNGNVRKENVLKGRGFSRAVSRLIGIAPSGAAGRAGLQACVEERRKNQADPLCRVTGRE